MTDFLKSLPIAKKLMLINVIVVVSALVLASGIFIGIERTSVRERIINELISQTQIIGYNVAAAVAFDDADAAKDTLTSLRAIPQIQEAIVFNKKHALFVEYRSANYRKPRGGYSEIESGLVYWPQNGDKPSVIFSDDGIYVFDQIKLDGEPLGALYIRSSLEQFNDYKKRAGAIAGAVLLGVLLISLIIMSNMVRLVSDPITRLMDAVSAVRKNNDYHVRVTKDADDELGHLTDAFNAMLVEIGRRDEELHRHHLELEYQVEERTSELQSANRSLEETVKALQQANKAIRISEESKRVAEASAEAKSQFLANMSHELRTPMNGVLGMLSLLSETKLNQDQSHYVNVAYESGNLLLELLNNVLDLSKIEQGKLSLESIEFDFVDAIEEVFAIVGESALSKGVELTLALDNNEIRRVKGDPIRFKQIVFNLVGNAIKFTSEGYVQVRYSLVARDEDNLRLRFEVVDTGIGVKEDVKELIFEMFSQADSSTTRNYGGTGLGLALCRQLTRIMKGQIGVESTYGVGSVFWFELSFAPAATLEKPAITAENRAGHIVFVDNNDVSASAFVSYFQNANFITDRATNHKELYQLLESRVIRGESYHGIVISMNLGLDEVMRIVVSEDVQCCVKPDHVVLFGSLSDRNRAKEHARLLNYPFLVKPMRRQHVDEVAALMLSDQRIELPGEVKKAATLPTMRQRVLVVEDNRINQQVALGRLENMGFDVHLASNGEEALSIVNKESFDLIFMDCQMPVLDGFQATKRIRQNEAYGKKRIPIIAMTAHVMAGDREACMRAGMDDYVAKPFKTEELKLVVDRWLHG